MDSFSARVLGWVLLVTVAGGASADEYPKLTLEKVNLVTPNGVYSYSPTDHNGLTTDFIAITKVDGGTMIPTDWARTQFPAANKR